MTPAPDGVFGMNRELASTNSQTCDQTLSILQHFTSLICFFKGKSDNNTNKKKNNDTLSALTYTKHNILLKQTLYLDLWIWAIRKYTFYFHYFLYLWALHLLALLREIACKLWHEGKKTVKMMILFRRKRIFLPSRSKHAISNGDGKVLWEVSSASVGDLW